MRLIELHGARDEAQTHEAWRLRIAAALYAASAQLVRLARQVERVRAAAAKRRPELEFYAEAGAPEGALFLDGERVGTLQGVTRL